MIPCRACGSVETTVIHEALDVPVSSCVLVTSRADALGFPRGALRLSVCHACGFIQNDLFDPALVDYTQGYEESQAASATFRAFVDAIAGDLIQRHDLRAKEVLEVGCGKGEWLARVCELGDMRGIGLDPAFVPGRLPAEQAERFTVLQEVFDEQHTHLTADLIACRHTLEHIGPVQAFVRLLHKSAQQRTGSVTFVEVPDTARILHEGAFWDVYYEHAAYFTVESLTRLFHTCGFGRVAVRRGYADQYLLLEAFADRDPTADREQGPAAVVGAANAFASAARASIDEWNRRLRRISLDGERAVIWGASSKAVGFLTALELGSALQFAVDINPMKHGQFLPGCGQEIVPPSFLTEYRPDVVIVMNPVYRDEIAGTLDEMGVASRLVNL